METIDRMLNAVESSTNVDQASMSYFQGLNLLLRMNDSGSYDCAVRVFKSRRHLVPRILLQFQTGNFVKFFRLVKQLTTIEQCAVMHFIRQMREWAIKCCNIAYCSKNLRIPCDVLADWLCIPASSIESCAIALGIDFNADTKGLRFCAKSDLDSPASYSKLTDLGRLESIIDIESMFSSVFYPTGEIRPIWKETA